MPTPPRSLARYRVTRECLCHELCCDLAPANFSFDEESHIAVVSRQPTTPDEEAACQRACEDCPVGAIEREPA